MSPETNRGSRGFREGRQQRGRDSRLGAFLTEKTELLFGLDPPDNSGPMTKFIQSAPSKSLLFMVTHDDGSSR